MFKRYFSIGILTLLFSVLTFAQNMDRTGGFARLQGMGGNPYVVDPFFTTVNPAWGGVYDNLVFGDWGSSAGAFSSGGFGQFISANFSLGQGWTLGGMLTRNDFNGFSIATLDPGDNLFGGAGVVSTINAIVGAGSVLPMDNNVELMSTYTTGKTIVGLGVAYASTTNDFTPAGGSKTEGSATQFGVNAGLLAKVTKKFKIDLGASLLLPSSSFTPGTGTKTDVSQTIIFVNARAFWKALKNVTFVPTIGFMNATGTIDATTSTDMTSVTTVAAGFGASYRAGDFLIAGGPAFSTTSITTPLVENVSPELSTTILTFPVWNIGLEWYMNDWFIARFGYVAVTGKTTSESAATPTTINESEFTFFLTPQRGATLGVGFRLGDFFLDATVNEDVLRQGFNNIGGGGATFAYLSAGYAIP